MAFDPDAYLAKKGPVREEFDPDAYLAAKGPPAAIARSEGPYRDETDPSGRLASKPVKYVEPFHVTTEEEKFNQKSGLGQAWAVLTGRSPMQTQRGIDQGLSKYGAGPGTQQYRAMENERAVTSTVGGMMAGGAAGGAAARGLLPHVATLPGRIGVGALSGTAGGGVGAATETAAEGGALGEVAESAKQGAAVGALVGGGLSTVGETVAAVGRGAPKRVAEAELAGLKEGVKTKTRLNTFEPNEEHFRQALNARPDIRKLIKADPRAAEAAVEGRLREVAEQGLDPIYANLVSTGRDRVPVDLVVKQLQAAKAGFNPIAEKAQIAVANSIIDDVTAAAAEQGGTLPVSLLRETATSFQRQGFANLPMLGQVPLTKQIKQGVGSAFRAAVGDHLESLAGNDPAGKAVRGAYEAANREYSTWARISEIVEEKAARLRGNAPPMADYINDGIRTARHYVKHPWEAAVDAAAGAPGVVDRNVLAPAARGALRPGPGHAQAATSTHPLLRKVEEQRERDRQSAARLRGEVPWR